MSENYSGSSFIELYSGRDPWDFYIPPLSISKHGTVLYEFPYEFPGIPKPHIVDNPKDWDDDHVKMPFSPKNLLTVKDGDELEKKMPAWEIICKSLEGPITSFSELQEAIRTYTGPIPKLLALEYFLDKVLEKEESIKFFDDLLPRIIKLALRLPEIIPGSIPLLKQHHNKSISLSQLQVSSLLANGFLCTLPWREELLETYPGVDFVRLYSSFNGPGRFCVLEKIKCIVHYFRKILNSEPQGIITFERIFIPKKEMPKWGTLKNTLDNTKVHITSSGCIEDASGCLQVDFANRNVGGGVLGFGCVQEEIRFVICPELLISRLFVERLDHTETVVIRGVERFSSYIGYGETFKWSANFTDETPFDRFGRRQTTVVVMDATCFFKEEKQYLPHEILRELGKAYAGFHCNHADNLAPVATGNWGCGAFQGNAKLKSLIQLMACNVAHRDLVYYTHGDLKLQDDIYEMYLFIVANKITICELLSIICKFADAKLSSDQFYDFIRQSWSERKSMAKIAPKKTCNCM
ncbi:hypothetical protein HHI36_019184 [Cryptolaemus montrouzieri]|uniref:poly(ADP-ribose) glycohydrolase n=1 Tax=Cryptolaemus montrouzieri TaxID=559131 RepID=A0ABD2P2Q1_9CUCU